MFLKHTGAHCAFRPLQKFLPEHFMFVVGHSRSGTAESHLDLIWKGTEVVQRFVHWVRAHACTRGMQTWSSNC